MKKREPLAALPPVAFIAGQPEWPVVYVNWRNTKALRRLRPLRLRFGVTEWHPEPQWLLEAVDLDTEQTREFALRDMQPA